MKKFMTLFFITILSVPVMAQNVCVDIEKKAPSDQEITLYKQIYPFAKHFSNEKIAQEIDKRRVFAYSYLKNHQKLDKNTSIALRLVIESFLASKYIEDFKKKHQPTEKDLRSFYLDHKDSFKPVEKVDIAVIAVDSLKKADEIYIRLKKHPEKFSDIAKKESLDPMAYGGGEYKNISLLELHPKVRMWIREHKEGDISEPIKIGRFYYIDKIEKKSRTDTSYESLKEDIKKILIENYVANQLDKEYHRLQEKQ